MTALPLLNVSDFTYAKRGHFLFEKLSFTLGAGEGLVLKGPNGSGKTTLLRCLAGIPDALPDITKASGLTQSYVGHLNALKAGLTVQQNLCHQTGVTPVSLAKTLEGRGLLHLLDREVRTLSAGQRRQVALLRLPLSGATLWLADEPTAHLDDTATTRFWQELDTHLKKGGAAILTSHTHVPLPHIQVMPLHG
ncbi:MAG: Heme exporter protein [Alphaproteobacteria bacterium]|jgi:heme exporter protein A|nr:Heme exporter protein [Alphaproteobacteria bacterium]